MSIGEAARDISRKAIGRQNTDSAAHGAKPIELFLSRHNTAGIGSGHGICVARRAARKVGLQAEKPDRATRRLITAKISEGSTSHAARSTRLSISLRNDPKRSVR
jgi:hypothetical protein